MQYNRNRHQPHIATALILGAVLAFAASAPAAETYCVVKMTDMDKKVSYKIMSPEDFKQEEAVVKKEAALFPKAEELVKKEWKADEANKSTPFPARLVPRKIEVVTRETVQEKADKKLESLESAEIRRQEPPAKKGKQTDAEKKQEEIKIQKERDLEKAYELVKDKIAEMVAKADEAKNKTDGDQPKADEAQPKADEAKPKADEAKP